MKSAVPILTYHSLDDSESVISVRPDVFASHVQDLATRGFTSMTLSAALAALRGEGELPERAVVITFDDGYLSVLTEGVPVLEAHGFTATVYLVPGYADRPAEWPANPAALVSSPLVDWDEASALRDAGVEIGAHSLTHPDLTRLSPAEAEMEILGSRDSLKERLGVEVRTFAHPFGAHDEGTRSIVAAHFDAACGTRMGRATPASDPYLLPRVDAYYARNSPRLGMLTRPFVDLRLAGRQVLRDLRSAFSGGSAS
jgi:peptidoglycan/xylan/chitin deacetylase (PgdA/CDA1 family)